MACGCWVVSCKDVSPDLDEPFRKLWWANHLSEAVFLERFEFETFSGFQNRAKRARCSVCHVLYVFLACECRRVSNLCKVLFGRRGEPKGPLGESDENDGVETKIRETSRNGFGMVLIFWTSDGES